MPNPKSKIQNPRIPSPTCYDLLPGNFCPDSVQSVQQVQRMAMKLVCAQSDLSTNLSLVSRAVPSRPTHPVLANVLLTADEETQQVQLTGFDLSVGIRTSFAARVEEGGEITLPAKILNDIVSRMPEGDIQLEERAVDAESEAPETSIIATLTSTSGSYTVRGMEAADFPALPVIEDSEAKAIYLPAEALIEGLRGCLFASSPDETKQVLTGVHLTLDRDGIEFAATDGHRLAVVETVTNASEDEEEEYEDASEAEELEVTVPARALRELERMIGMRQSPEPVALHLDGGQIVFELGTQRLTSRKLEGMYPNYRMLIPNQFLSEINLERRRLLSALERIAVIADQKNHIVKCTVDSDNQEIYLSVEAQDVGSGREALPADISGDEPKEIAFNVRYLMDILKTMTCAEVTVKLNDMTSPVILTPLSGQKQTFLVMPVQLRA
jgi:DNA polymerase-3 subunit beta